ncbi:MAG: hypothetical protein K1000chlam1_00633 [Candidatus Anoxychlamydiales bacterium]|nr:hypothetical protein [Candidatus Anoxychlamydiales bacterium]
MQAVGIEIDGERINLAILNKKKDLIKLKSLDASKINPIKNVKPFYIFGKKNVLISTGLDTQDVLIKNTSFNVKKSFFLKRAIKFQKESITTIDPSKTITEAIYLKDLSKLKFFITTKELLKKHLYRLKKLKIDPDQVTSVSSALCRFASHYFKDIKNAYLVHISESKTSCIFMKDNMAEKSSIIKIGLNKLKQVVFENKKNSNSKIDVLENAKKGELQNILNELKQEIERAFSSFIKNDKDKYPMLITGDIDSFLNLDSFLQNKKTSEILQSSVLEENGHLKSQAISIGLALNLLAKDRLYPQFRKSEFTPAKKLKTIGRKITFLCFFSIIFSYFLYLGSNYFIGKTQDQLHEKLNFLKKFENGFFTTDKPLITDNFYTDLKKYEKTLVNETKEFPYFLKVLNVTQTLYWLNNNEHLKDGEIISFDYKLDKYPNIFAKRDPYQAIVEIVFKTDKPSFARSFYDSLTQGETIADEKQTISWDVQDDSYKTQFYLKQTKF